MSINVSNALQAGFLVGIYHFAHPENRPTTNGAVQEADHFMTYAGSAIGPGRLRPVLDIEVTITNLTDWVLAFIQEVENNRGVGAAPIIYCLSGGIFDSRVSTNTLWIASPTANDPVTYNSVPTGSFANWGFWQYGLGS